MPLGRLHEFSHTTTSTACANAISSMQDTLLFAPGPILEAVSGAQKSPTLIKMRGFHASIDQISAVDVCLAEAFTAVNRKLEALTMSVTSDMATDYGVWSAQRMDPFGRLVVWQQVLVAERYEIISQILVLPGFGNSLKTDSFDTLRSAAVRGPVIIINHYKAIRHPHSPLQQPPLHPSPSPMIYMTAQFN